jgi:hypothetical protein
VGLLSILTKDDLRIAEGNCVMPQESNGVGQKFVHNILILSGCGNSAHAS